MLNRREFNRVKLDKPILATLELITRSFSNDLSLNDVVHVHVVDISAGGLRFISKVELFVNFLANYKIHLTLNNNDLVFLGKIIRKTKIKNSYYEYGIRFEFDLVI
jgi:hypothetical protein